MIDQVRGWKTSWRRGDSTGDREKREDLKSVVNKI